MRIIATQQARPAPRHDSHRQPAATDRAAGRALATPRDVARFRAAELPAPSAGSVTPFLAQRLAQLWPVAAPVLPEATIAAYIRAAASPETPRPVSMVA